MSYETVLKASIDGGYEHFAPSETITVQRVEDAPPGTKIEKLTLVITDRNDGIVYKAVWSRRPEPPSPKIASVASGGPPASFTWDGVNNQRGEVKDEDEAAIVQYVTPLDSPFTIKLFALLTEEEPLEKPPEGVLTDLAIVTCEADVEKPVCAIESLTVVAGKETSRSYRTLESAILPDDASRFCYAPFAAEESELEITWTLKTPGEVSRGRLQLFSPKHKNRSALWTYELDAEAVRKGKLTRADCSSGAFLDEHLTVKGSPYKLRMTIGSDEATVECNRAWTYIDVLVDSIELYWGDAKMLSARDPEDQLRAEEMILLRRLKGIDGAPESRAPEALIKDDDAAGRTRVDFKACFLELSSNVFYQDVAEWHNGLPFKLYQDLWGDGPRVPLVADLKVRSSSGASVDAPRALRGLELLWDWEDPRLDKAEGASTKEWLQWAFEREGGHGGNAHSPRSTNCPVVYGGKRGEGASPVFTGGADPEVFPFAVRAADGFRSWAALSRVYEGESPKLASKTGVLFQPSRIGGDTYRVRVYLYTGIPEDFDHAIQGDELWGQAEDAGLPRSGTGTFEIWRRVDILRYLKKGDKLPAIDFDAVEKSMAVARIKLGKPPVDDVAVKDMWGPLLAKLLAEKAKDGRYTGLLKVVAPADEQLDNGYGIKLKSWATLADEALTAALDELLGGIGTKKKGDQKRRARLDGVKRRLLASERPARWRKVFEYLSPEECDALAPLAKRHSPVNLAASAAHNVRNMEIYLASPAIRQTINQNLFLPLVEEYAGTVAELSGSKAPLGGNAGVLVLHMASVFPGQCDLSGGAIAVSRKPAERGWGMFFAAYPPDPDDILQIDATEGRFKLHALPITLSRDFQESYGNDFDTLLGCLANGAMKLAVESVDLKSFDPSAPAPLVGVSEGAHIKIKSRSADFVAEVKGTIEGYIQPKIVDGTHDKNDRLVYLSPTGALEGVVGVVKFGMFSETLGKSSKRAIRDFVVRVYDQWHFPVSDLHILYADTGSGRARRDVVHAYLDALIKTALQKIKINPTPDDARLPAVYGLNALVGHELGHTLFLPHAEPEENKGQWRHVHGYSCLMNYDPSSEELCGGCVLALRGWDIGSESSANFSDGAPAWKGPPLPTKSPAILAPPEEEEDDGWHRIGFHGTSSVHRSSLKGGLKPTGAVWDPRSGGELGVGFYVTTDYPTACLYGADMAQLKGSRVDIWLVESRIPLEDMKGKDVPVEEQYAQIPQAYGQDFDYLWNALEEPIAQYKFNEGAYPHLRIRHFRELSVNAAFDEAERKADSGLKEKLRKGDEVPGKKVRAKGDGDCFFHALAYHVKEDDLGRAPFAGGDRVYGDDPAELVKSTAVRREIADWLSLQIYGVSVDNLAAQPPSGTYAGSYQSWWNHLTDNGNDTSHFGANMRETIKNMPYNNQTVGGHGALIWGDIGFVWRAVVALYHRKVVVHYGRGAEPVTFGAGEPPITLHHTINHYNIIVPD